MDMGGMDMGGMGSDGGIFTNVNEAIAQGFWYGVAGCVGFMTLTRLASALQSRQRLRQHRLEPHRIPSRPRTRIAQSYATATALFRELIYAQPVYFTGRLSRFFSPMPVGRWLLLTFYWIVVLCFLWSNTILQPSDLMYAYKWEKVGYRAAWVSVTQIPFIYLLSCKFNPISLLTGISYERFNWLHRWAARTVFLTVTVHWSFFFTEWYIGNYVDMELKTMSMVKYGFGAWGVITWMMLSGFGYFRNLNYELFVLQHIVGAGVLLWLLFVHVPVYAQYNIWLSIGFLVFDWGARILWGTMRNTHLLGGLRSRIPGYSTRLEILPGDVVRLSLDAVDFNWQPGQHVYIAIPTLRPFEIHPFTIANAPSIQHERQEQELTLLIQAQSGFSRTLYKAASRITPDEDKYRTFISGPWGCPPNIVHYETVVMIACASGASFIMPILQDLVQKRGCVRKIVFHWIIRSQDQFSWFGEELNRLIEKVSGSQLSLQIQVHITRETDNAAGLTATSQRAHEKPAMTVCQSISSDSGSSSLGDEKSPISHAAREASIPSMLTMSHRGRPNVEALIRPAVEQALGETAVVVCGGLSVTVQCRNFVAALSDERAVHKGTGAQGIFLFTETFGW